MVKEAMPENKPSYLQLLSSMLTLASCHPRLMVSGLIQGMNFAGFIALWLGIGLHLTGDVLGHGSDLVGYLTAFSAIGLVTTTRLGQWADRTDRKARLLMSSCQFGAVLLLWTAETNWIYLLPLAIMSVVGPIIDVTGRMTGLQELPDIRTRLMSLYVCMMFTGAGIGSWAGTMVYDIGAWRGMVLLMMLFSGWSGCCRGSAAALAGQYRDGDLNTRYPSWRYSAITSAISLSSRRSRPSA